MRLAGLALAGGRSRRFGHDKALAAFGGRRLIDWSLDALHGCAVVGISGPPALEEMLRLPCIADREGLLGPLAGILAGMGWALAAGCTHLLTVPCDTPFLPSDLRARLSAGIGERSVVAARAERVHPLCALWRCDRPEAFSTMATLGRQASLQRLIEQAGGGFIDFDDEAAFANLNTPDDMVRAAGRPITVTQNKP